MGTWHDKTIQSVSRRCICTLTKLNKVFIYKELTSKVIVGCSTIAVHRFRTRLGFKQYDVILTKQQSVLTKIKSSLEAENMQT